MICISREMKFIFFFSDEKNTRTSTTQEQSETDEGKSFVRFIFGRMQICFIF